MRSFYVTSDGDEVECSVGAQRSEFSLGLEPHHVGQFFGRSRGERQQLDLYVVAADADERCHFAQRVSGHSGRQPRADLFSA